MNGLALCSGIGGLDLALARVVPGYRTVCHVERDAYAEALIRKWYGRRCDEFLEGCACCEAFAALDKALMNPFADGVKWDSSSVTFASDDQVAR